MYVQGNCVVLIHGNPQKNTGMWASRPCETEKHAFLCQRGQGDSTPTTTTTAAIQDIMV